MAHVPPGGTDYAPLPLTHDSEPTRLYNAPPSPEPGAQFAIPTTDHDGMPYTDDMGIPLGAAQPRFIGRALYDDGGAGMRNSIASSHQGGYPSSDRASEYTAADSVYNLNAAKPYTEGGAYHDEPGFFNADQPIRRGNEKRAAYASPRSRRKKLWWIVGGVLLLVIIAAAVLYFAVFKKKNSSSSSSDNKSSSSSSSTSTSSSSKPVVAVAVTGSDGSTVTAEDGSTFTYTNSFGGTWYWDVNDPFNNGARPQSWSPALNETFTPGVNKVRGVNIGGWLVTEPFIVPALYQSVQATTTSITVIDEYTLMQAGGQSALEDHYATFITEQDFMEIAAAGLNFVRIPLPYWAIQVLDGEGFLGNVAWTYFLKAIQWARKYGLRINLDLHALPGSQNGWNHSGRLGSFNVLYGPMGIANAQRSLDYVRILAEFISQPEYSPVIAMFGVTNEPQGNSIGQDVLSRYYLQAYNNVRLASGTGAGNGPYVSFHDGFFGPAQWSGFLPNADRASLDMHPYLCFGGQSADPITSRTSQPCSSWGQLFNDTMSDFGFIVAGEWSNAVTDCGTYVNGVGQGTRYEGTFAGTSQVFGNCTTDWLDWENWDAGTKQAYMTFAKSSMDALQVSCDFLLGRASTGSSGPGKSATPPPDASKRPNGPTSSASNKAGCPPTRAPPLANAATPTPSRAPSPHGKPAARAPAKYPLPHSPPSHGPPPSIAFADATSPVASLPSFTPSGTPITLPGPTITPASGQPSATSSASVGSGWENTSGDTAGMMGPIPGCSYLDPWIGSSVSPPSPLCTGATRKREKRRVEEWVEARATEVPVLRR
ncbi:Glycoside hydrolase [Mycena sanguinolenta]|uniref:glucan 1,3-beta-glucosidase n=1 Tax=Mycena sanguinolenta TaxID=230812 RepID=A0A8H6YHP9_9AGAR|nr:Glycoside hydrolase [Mycena sanguinolenta]